MCAPLVTWHTLLRYSSSCLTHTRVSTRVHRYSSLLRCSVALGQRGHVGGSFAYCVRNAHYTVTTDLIVWYSNIQKDFCTGAVIFLPRALTSPSCRNVNYDEKWLAGQKKVLSHSVSLYRFHKYVPYRFRIIDFCNPGVHYVRPCISEVLLVQCLKS